MKSSFRLIMRKTRLHIPQLIGLMLLLVVGVCFFVTLFTIVKRYEETAEQYFIEQAYADITFYGVFNNESVEILSAQQGVLLARGRMVRDFREDERTYRVISLTDGINIPYIYEGRLPENETECIILNRNAKAMNLSIGDIIILGDKEVIITGLAASPEYIYMVQNERTLMAQTYRFAVVYVVNGFYPEGYNEIVAHIDNSVMVDALSERIDAFRSILQKDQVNHWV